MAEGVFALPDLGEGLEEATITAWYGVTRVDPARPTWRGMVVW